MTGRRTLILLTTLMLLAFAVRVLPLDTQSMWRDEIDTLCFALGFWDKIQQAISKPPSDPSVDLPVADPPALGQGSADRALSPSPVERPNCQPTPGLSRVDPSRGLWPTVRALLTLPGWNGPLYTVAMRPWISLTGHSPFALRFNSLIFGLLAVPLSYVLGRRLLGVSAGLIGATLVGLSPHLVWYSQEAKMYGVLLALGLLAIYGLRRAVDRTDRAPVLRTGRRLTGIHTDQTGEIRDNPHESGSRSRRSKSATARFESLKWWGLVISATTLALYCHVLAVLLIPLLVVLGLIWWPRTRRHWRGASVALALLTLPYLPLLAWQARNWLLPAGQATLFNTARLDVMLETTFEGWGGNFVGEPWATLILAGLALLALVGLASVWFAGGETENQAGDRNTRPALTFGWREPLALLVWMALPLLGIWLISARQPIFTNRYLIWAAPAFYLLVATGAITLVQVGRGGALIAAGLVLVILAGDGRALWQQATQPIKPDFQAAAAYLQDRYQPGDLIVFHLSYMQNNFDFYFTGPYDGWGAPAPGNGMPESDVDFYMRTNTSGHENVWLVLSESEMWDPRGLIRAWMDAHAVNPPQEQIFAHVSVHRYRLDK